MNGLSPRVRGNHFVVAVTSDKAGSIPARAGEPGDDPGRGGLMAVYPRACGGTFFAPPPVELCRGLSPRVRGNRYDVQGRDPLRGSIPARAGEPCSWRRSACAGPVYPRACGGTIAGHLGVLDESGLSPRVRGNHWAVPSATRFAGSIPARAGEPRAGAPPTPASPVYPRACGGTPRIRVGNGLCEGLSPRVRGNLREARG